MPRATDGHRPIGSGRFRDYAQDSDRVLGRSFVSSLALKKAVRHTFTAEQDGEEVVLLVRVEAATGNTLQGISHDKSSLLPAPQSPSLYSCWRKGCPMEPVDRESLTFFAALTTPDPWCRACSEHAEHMRQYS